MFKISCKYTKIEVQKKLCYYAGDHKTIIGVGILNEDFIENIFTNFNLKKYVYVCVHIYIFTSERIITSIQFHLIQKL